MNFKKLLISYKEKRQGVSNQAFNQDNHEACAPNERGRSWK